MIKKEISNKIKDIKESIEFIEKKTKRGDIGFMCDDVINKINELEEEIMG